MQRGIGGIVSSLRADALFEAFTVEEGIEELQDLAFFFGAELVDEVEAALQAGWRAICDMRCIQQLHPRIETTIMPRGRECGRVLWVKTKSAR